MSQGVTLYFLVALVTHFSIISGMAILAAVGHSVYSTMRKERSSNVTSRIFKEQIRYIPIVIIISILTGSLQLIVPAEAANLFYPAALLVDIAGPLLVLAQTLGQIQAAKAETGPQ